MNMRVAKVKGENYGQRVKLIGFRYNVSVHKVLCILLGWVMWGFTILI